MGRGMVSSREIGEIVWSSCHTQKPTHFGNLLIGFMSEIELIERNQTFAV